MLQTLFGNYRIVTLPPELAGDPNVVIDGVLARDIATGRVVRHLQEVARLPGALLQGIGAVSSILNLGVSVASFAYMRSQFNALNRRLDQIERKIDVIDRKLDVLVGMVQQVDHKVDALAHALANVAGRIDARHRDDVFAEIGAVLDTLAYADRKSPQDAATLIASNITPARKAIRRYLSLVDEYEAPLAASDPARSEVIRMRFLAGILTIKIDLAMGEKESAHDQACQLAKEIGEQSRTLLAQSLTLTPLTQLVQALAPDEVVQLCSQMESIDGMAPTQRMAQALSTSRISAEDSPHITPLDRTVRFCMSIDSSKSNAPTYALSVKLPFGSLSFTGLSDSIWAVSSMKKPGEFIRKGEVVAVTRIGDIQPIDLQQAHEMELMRQGITPQQRQQPMEVSDYHVELLSPFDGIMVENLIDYGKMAADGWPIRYPIIRVEQTPDQHESESLSTSDKPAQPERSALIEGIDTLARLMHAASGTAVETALLANQADQALTISGQPFEVSYILQPAS